MELFKASENNNQAHLFELKDGTVFTTQLGTFEFKDNKIYEVEFGGYEIEPCINPYWNKVGKSYTLDEFQKLVNGVQINEHFKP